MAQAGFTPISLYFSSTAAAVPTSGNLANGELALNIADMKLYAKNSAGTVTLLASSGGAAGTVSSVQVSGGTTGLTTSGGPITTSGTITLAGTLGTANGGTNLTSFTSGGVVYASSSSALATGSALQFDGTDLLLASGGLFDIDSTNAAVAMRIRQTTVGAGTEFTTTITENTGVTFDSSDSAGATARSFVWTAAGTEGMRLTSTGLGIGTSLPTQKLEILAANRATDTTGQVFIRTSDAYAANVGGQLTLGGAYNATPSSYAFAGIAGRKEDSSTNVAGYLQMSTTTSAGALTERARIDSSGNLLVGTTSNANSDKLVVNGSVYQFQTVNGSSASPVTNGGYLFGPNSSTIYGGIRFINQILSNNSIEVAVYTTSTAGSAAEVARFSNTGGFSVGTTANPGAGAIYATGNITAYYSDERLKDVKGRITNALAKVRRLSGVYYTNNETAKSFGYTSDEMQVGVLANQMKGELPEIVKPAPFDLDENGNSKSGENYMTVQYDRGFPLLIEALKELADQFDAYVETH